MHQKQLCKHGIVVSQCRCPNPHKVTVEVPCPEYCDKRDSETITPTGDNNATS